MPEQKGAGRLPDCDILRKNLPECCPDLGGQMISRQFCAVDLLYTGRMAELTLRDAAKTRRLNRTTIVASPQSTKWSKTIQKASRSRA